MSSLERWKPIFVIFIFSFAFFEFSQIPFTEDSEIDSNIPAAQHRIKKSISRRSIDDTQPPVEISANAGSASDVPRSKRRLKKNNPYYESDGRRDERSRSERRRKKKSRSSGKTYSRSSKSKSYYKRYKSLENEDYDYFDDNEYKNSGRKKYSRGRRKHKKTDAKRKTSLVYTSLTNRTLLNPKPPLDLPIVKPEMLVDDKIARLIPTKERPFHFHIPLVSKSPVAQSTIDELMVTALKYKNPLTLEDNNEVQAAKVSTPTLTLKQRSSIKRMVRDSPILDFLNIAALIVAKRGVGGPEEVTAKVNGSSTHLSTPTREVIQVNVTDELLQEILGDEDDLMGLKDRLKSDAAYAGEGLKQSEKMVGSDLFKSSNQEQIDKNAIRRRRQGSPADFHGRNELEFLSDSSEKLYNIRPRSGRVKRGLGKWLKKVFGKKDKTTTTTTSTTKAPRKKKKESSEESSSKKGRKAMSTFFELKTDEKGDTEVDKLLPTYLRRSSYLARKYSDNPTDNKKNKDSFEEELGSKKGSSEDSGENKKKKRRTKRSN